MTRPSNFFCFALCGLTILLGSCVEDAQSTGMTSTLTSKPSPMGSGSSNATALSKHDIALRFLTAYIRLDRNMALQFATPQAVNKLDWNMPHGANIPYYDDKMLLQFRGGWARVFFQDMGDTYKIVDIEVHRR